MSREEVLRISRAAYSNSLNTEDVTTLLTRYCIKEYNKSVEDTNKFINILLSTKILFPQVLTQCIEIALEYYERKFIINKVLKDNKIIYIY